MDAQKIIDKCFSTMEEDQADPKLITGFKFFALGVDGNDICLCAANAFIADVTQRDSLSGMIEVISKVIGQEAVSVTRENNCEFRIHYRHPV